MQNLITRNRFCRGCKGSRLTKVLSFGPTPLANAFLNSEQVNQPEYSFPLDVYFCRKCSLLQLLDVISPEYMFKDYVYVSSTSPVFVKHFEDFAERVFERFNLNQNSLVVDIGSNDGILLRPFKRLGTRVLGVEPALTVAKLAVNNGIETLSKFFGLKTAGQIVKNYGPADVVGATNVFAHVNDLDDLIMGVKRLLKKNGVFIIEVPYLIDFLEKNLFDTVYHEHLSYFCVKTMMTVFERLGMKIFDVQKVPTHGGSIRVFVKGVNDQYPIEKNVRKFLENEKRAKLTSIQTYLQYANKIHANRAKLINLLVNLKLAGKRIAGYGAPGKGNTFLNYFSIGSELLEFIADDSPQKQGLYTPGKHIPVVSSAMIYKRKPDYLLIIAWNFAEPIMKNHSQFKKSGGKFIIPIPTPKII